MVSKTDLTRTHTVHCMPGDTPSSAQVPETRPGIASVTTATVGPDLSRRRVDVCLISGDGELIEYLRAPADRDGLYGLTRRVVV